MASRPSLQLLGKKRAASTPTKCKMVLPCFLLPGADLHPVLIRFCLHALGMGNCVFYQPIAGTMPVREG